VTAWPSLREGVEVSKVGWAHDLAPDHREHDLDLVGPGGVHR
jgi:hypothetical protein